MTSTELKDYLYYQKLPQIYRDMDAKQNNYPLKRYLSALVEDGFFDLAVNIDSLIQLVDPEKCPTEFLPYLCYSFGLEYFEDIDDVYQRRLLSNIGEIIRRRGTYSCVKFLIRTLTGLDSRLIYYRGERDGVYGRWLIAELQAENVSHLFNQVAFSVKVVERYIKTQIPFYVNVVINAGLVPQTIAITRTTRPVISQRIAQDLIPSA